MRRYFRVNEWHGCLKLDGAATLLSVLLEDSWLASLEKRPASS